MASTATPTPIPIFAPRDRPPFDPDDACGVGVDVGVDGGMVLVAVLGAVTVAPAIEMLNGDSRLAESCGGFINGPRDVSGVSSIVPFSSGAMLNAVMPLTLKTSLGCPQTFDSSVIQRKKKLLVEGWST